MIKIKEQMIKNRIKLALMAVMSVMAAQANASWYDIVYTQTAETDLYGHANPPSVTDAVGQLNVVGNVAVAGSLQVLSGPDIGNYILVGNSISTPGGASDGQFQFDDLVYPLLNNGGFLSAYGLLWSQSGSAGNSPEMNMWYNPFDQFDQPVASYSLWGLPPLYNPESWGTISISAVPEPTTIITGGLMLLPFGVSTVRFLRKKVTANC